MAVYAIKVNSILTAFQAAAQQPLPLLILDFDGTICLGDGPVLAYAQAAASQLDADQQQSFMEQVSAFLTGNTQSTRYKDGYAAVASLANGALSPEQLDWAYAESRKQLAAGTVEISTAPGLADLLGSLEGIAHRLLLTNAPLRGVAESLQKLGLAPGIDAVITDAGKPEGFNEFLQQLTKFKAPYQVLSVGDVWANDIQAPASAGCATAFIDRFNHRNGPASISAATIEELYPGIRAWAQDPALFDSTNNPNQ